MIFKDLFEDFFKNILRIFPQNNHKNNKEENGYGSCYLVYTHMLDHVKIG
jgi:hypothetical protein